MNTELEAFMFNPAWLPSDELPNDEKKAVCPTYTRALFNPGSFRDIVDWCASRIAALQIIQKQAEQPSPSASMPSGQRIRAVAGCGHSGLIVAAAVGYRLGIPVIAIRKDGETDRAHDSYDVNACLTGREQYAIIDDLVGTGRTLVRIVREVGHYFPTAEPALVLLYHDKYTDVDTVRKLDHALANVTVLNK